MVQLTDYQNRKHKRGLCITPFCRNAHARDRKHCHKCSKRRWRENNPLKASYCNLKTNAKRRGKQFDLTFEEFKEIARQAEFKDRGIKRMSYHLDRIDETKGYTKDNLQLLPNYLNIKKYKNYVNGTTTVSTRIEDPTQIDNEAPF